MKYCKETCTVECSVELLCEKLFGEGDLGGYGGAEALYERRDSGEIVARLQKEAGAFYQTNLALSHTAKAGNTYLCVSGSPTGVIRHTDGPEVDVVKCVRGREALAPPGEQYLAELRCYAYFLACRENLPTVRARLTYYQTDQKKLKSVRYRLEREKLKQWYEEILREIAWQVTLVEEKQTSILPEAAVAPFPYPQLREGQELMIRECHSAIRRHKRIFVEAPTGTGKTVSALYPAVRALGEGHADKIFYLTAKASTGREAYGAAGKLHAAGIRLRTVMITAKESMCLCDKRLRGDTGGQNLCNPFDCEYARGYYARRRDALKELLQGHNGYPRGLILQTARHYGICPYELSLDLSEYCDIIICDYNYAFDPAVYFRRYFSPDTPGGETGRYVFLIDEAHNLADRARDMYSATLHRSEVERVAEQMAGADRELFHSLEALLMTMNRLKLLCRDNLVKDGEGRDQGFYMSRSPLTEFNGELEQFRKRCDAWIRRNREHPLFASVNGLFSRVRRYLSVGEYFDRGFLCYVELFGGDLTVKTYCLDPSPTMDALLNRASAAVLFSATLTPSEYFCDVLGGAKQATHVSLPSPFDPDRLQVAVADYLSTRLEDREKNYARYASVIAATVSAAPGNYIAYFPSYQCLEGVLKRFKKKYPRVETVAQKPGMGIREKEEFLGAFRSDEGHLRVGFCVLGGAFSEGVDLPGNRLIGAIVFGVGLPGLSNERNMIQEYFDQTAGQGYDYAYTYPGMNQVLQAVGRVIRRDGDRGVAVLVDDRYATPRYRSLFPAHWQGVQYAGNASSLAEIMRRFWENRE
ncbi:MAG: ATP-dependent DNA helicase [Clostridia bacterium]|nr:ATP-dependent DNA helicase [Clostridia bacterium]